MKERFEVLSLFTKKHRQEKTDAVDAKPPFSAEPKGSSPQAISQEKFMQIWERARSAFNFPVLREPKMETTARGSRGAHFDFSTGTTSIDAGLAKGLSEKSGVEFESIVEGLMVRAIGTYRQFPYDLANVLLLQDAIVEKCRGPEKDDEAFARHVFQSFCSLINDANSALHPGRREPMLALRQAIANANYDDHVHSLVLAYLKTQSGEPQKLFGEQQKLLEMMLRMDFVNAASDKVALAKAVGTWMEVLRQSEKEREASKKWGVGKFFGSRKEWGAGKFEPHDADASETMRGLKGSEVDEALAKAAARTSKAEFSSLKKFVDGIRGTEQEAGEGEGKNFGFGSGGFGVDRQTIDYYLKVMQNYPTVAGRRPVQSSEMGKAYRGTERFVLGSQLVLALPYATGGRIMPGLTMKIKEVDVPKPTWEYSTQGALIIIDSSDTAGNPRITKSVLVALAVNTAVSYHNMGAPIGVVNFGPKTLFLPYTRDLYMALGAIVAWQGGGTTLDTKIVNEMLGAEAQRLGAPGSAEYDRNLSQILGHPKYADVLRTATSKSVSLGEGELKAMLEGALVDAYFFSDMKISNLRKVMLMHEEMAGVNQVTIITNSNEGEVDVLPSPKIRLFAGVDDIGKGSEIIVQRAEEGFEVMRRKLEDGRVPHG